MDEIIGKLKAIIFTLNNVDVRGKDNMDHLLGSILSLEGVAAKLTQLQEEQRKAAQEAGK